MIRLIGLSLFAVVLVALGGCGSIQIQKSWHDPGPPLAKTAPLKGRAFVVGTVTVSPAVAPKGRTDIEAHCLPDPMYAAMLRQDLVLTFKNAGLTKGRMPAIPVNVSISFRYFVTNFSGLTASTLVTNTTFSGNRISLGIVGVGGPPKYRNRGPVWKYQRWTIPAMTLAITTGIHNVQEGRQIRDSVPFTSFGDGRGTTSWLFPSNFLFGKVNMYEVPHPMSVAEFEQATGKSAKELAGICQARIAGK